MKCTDIARSNPCALPGLISSCRISAIDPWQRNLTANRSTLPVRRVNLRTGSQSAYAVAPTRIAWTN